MKTIFNWLTMLAFQETERRGIRDWEKGRNQNTTDSLEIGGQHACK